MDSECRWHMNAIRGDLIHNSEMSRPYDEAATTIRKHGQRTTPKGGFDSPHTLSVFSVLIGLLSAALSRYNYGAVNQPVYLPEILRAVHPSYLTNDFWLNSASEFGPRFYYTQAFALAADFVSIPAISYLLFIVARCALSVGAAFATRDISGSSAAALIVASVSVSASPFRLGYEAGFSNAIKSYLAPDMLAEPFLLFAIWRGIRGEPIRAAAACVPAILMQPALGVGVAGIVFIAALSRCLRLTWPYCPKAREGAHFVAGFLLVGFATGLFWIFPAIGSGALLSSSLDSNEFVHIIASIRHPHHLIPSTWPVRHWGLAAAFAVATVIALAEFRRVRAPGIDQHEHRARVTAIMAIFVTMTFCFFAGWLFVEILPTRWAAAAHFYRLVVVFAWLGGILVAAAIANQLARKDLRLAALGLVSLFSAPALLLYQVALFTKIHGAGTERRATPLFVAVALLILVGVFILHRPNSAAPFVAVIGMGVAVAIAAYPRLAPISLAAMAVVLILVVGVLSLHRSGFLPEVGKIPSFVAHLQPVLTLDEVREHFKGRAQADLAAAAKAGTESDAVFLVPAKWKEWRLLARRAVVVDWKAFPFREEGMLEWNRRYRAVYDLEHGAGYPDDFTEVDFRELQEMYGFHYAVVPAGHPFPVVATSGKWTLVRASDPNLREN